jgi:hypothetical protein
MGVAPFAPFEEPASAARVRELKERGWFEGENARARIRSVTDP